MWFKSKAEQISNPPPGWNVPPSVPSTAGTPIAPWVPQGYSAPMLNEREESHGSLAFPQRLSERIVAFSTRVPLQGWLREQRTVLVTPMTVDANKLAAAGGPNRMNYGAADDAGWSSRQNSATSSPSMGGESQSAWRQGMYLRDYSLQTYQGRARTGPVFAPPAFQNAQSIADVTAQVELNGMYSVMNANQAAKYLNLRAPSPWESLGGC